MPLPKPGLQPKPCSWLWLDTRFYLLCCFHTPALTCSDDSAPCLDRARRNNVIAKLLLALVGRIADKRRIVHHCRSQCGFPVSGLPIWNLAFEAASWRDGRNLGNRCCARILRTISVNGILLLLLGRQQRSSPPKPLAAIFCTLNPQMGKRDGSRPRGVDRDQQPKGDFQ